MSERRTALITGASSGFGVEFAKLFARDGYDVVLVARSKAPMHELAERLQEVLSLSLALTEEIRGTGVTVTALCPGPTETGFQARAEMAAVRVWEPVPSKDGVSEDRRQVPVAGVGLTRRVSPSDVG